MQNLPDLDTNSAYSSQVELIDLSSKKKENRDIEIVNATSSTDLLKDTRTLPDGGYGWVVVAAAFICQVVAVSIPFTFGLYIQVYSETKCFEGPSSPAALAVVGSFANSGYTVLSIPIGLLINLYGHQRLCFIGGIFVASGLILASISTQYWQVLLTQGLLYGIGSGMVYLSSLVSISQWFDKKKGLAMGIATSGAGLGGLALAPLQEFMIRNMGYKTTLVIMGCSLGSLGSFSAFLLKQRVIGGDPTSNVAKKSSLKFSDIIKDKRFLGIYVCIAMSSMGIFTPFQFIEKFGVYYGFSSEMSALALGLSNGGNALGKLIFGRVADKLGYIQTLIFCLLGMGLSVCLIWPFATTLPVFIIFCIIYGTCDGGVFCVIPSAVISIFGAENATDLISITFSSLIIGSLLGAPFGGWILELSSFKDAAGAVTTTYWPLTTITGLFVLLGTSILIFTYFVYIKTPKS
jgi:MFS family permease